MMGKEGLGYKKSIRHQNDDILIEYFAKDGKVDERLEFTDGSGTATLYADSWEMLIDLLNELKAI